jgi:hypothetical protein
MAVRKTTSLLLALVFLCVVAVPSAIADGTPPSDGGEIHPWDNNDDFRMHHGGQVTSVTRPIIVVVLGPMGPTFVVYFGQPQRVIETGTVSRYSTDKTVRTRTVAAKVDNR